MTVPSENYRNSFIYPHTCHSWIWLVQKLACFVSSVFTFLTSSFLVSGRPPPPPPLRCAVDGQIRSLCHLQDTQHMYETRSIGNKTDNKSRIFSLILSAVGSEDRKGGGRLQLFLRLHLADSHLYIHQLIYISVVLLKLMLSWKVLTSVCSLLCVFVFSFSLSHRLIRLSVFTPRFVFMVLSLVSLLHFSSFDLSFALHPLIPSNSPSPLPALTTSTC